MRKGSHPNSVCCWRRPFANVDTDAEGRQTPAQARPSPRRWKVRRRDDVRWLDDQCWYANTPDVSGRSGDSQHHSSGSDQCLVDRSRSRRPLHLQSSPSWLREIFQYSIQFEKHRQSSGSSLGVEGLMTEIRRVGSQSRVQCVNFESDTFATKFLGRNLDPKINEPGTGIKRTC